MWLFLALAALMVVVYVWFRRRLTDLGRFSQTSARSSDPGFYGGSFGGGDGGFDGGGSDCGGGDGGGGGGGCD